MFVSEMKLKDIIYYIETFCPVKITFNDIVVYNDYDNNNVIKVLEDGTKIYGEICSFKHVVPNRIKNFNDYLVTSINIQIVDYHHSIIDIHGKLPDRKGESCK